MNKSFVKMLSNYGKTHKSGESYELDTETAEAWVSLGIAEKVQNPEEDLSSKFAKALDQKLAERDEALLKSIARVESKTPFVRVTQDEADKKKSLGHFVQLVHKATSSDDHDDRINSRKQLDAIYKSALQATVGNFGGYTIPEQYVAQLVELPNYPSVFRGNALSIPVSGAGPIRLPALDQSITPDGVGQSAFNAGVNVYWAGEIDDSTEVNPKFRQIELNPNRLTGYIPVANHLLLNSAIGVENLITRLFSNQVTAKLEYSYLLGNGVGCPLGMLDLNNNIVQSSARNTSSHVKYADVCKMWASLPASSQANAIWVISQSAIEDFLQMTTSNGWPLFQPSAQAGVNMQLFNRPVVISEFLPALGTARDVCLVDPSLYYMAETMSPVISTSQHVRFLKDEVVFKIEMWGDGQPAINYKPKLGDGSTTVSPAVYLAA